MPDDKVAGRPADKPELKGEPTGPPGVTMGPTPGYSEKDKKSAAEAVSQPPKRGKYTKVTALGTNRRVFKDKIYTNQGTYFTDWNHGEIMEIKKDPIAAAGFAIENFEDGELVTGK